MPPLRLSPAVAACLPLIKHRAGAAQEHSHAVGSQGKFKFKLKSKAIAAERRRRRWKTSNCCLQHLAHGSVGLLIVLRLLLKHK